MEIKQGDRWWQLEIEVRREILRTTVTGIKRRSERATALMALLALLVGIATVFNPKIWPLRMILAILTLASAIIVLSRVTIVKAEPAIMTLTVPKPTITRSCPECGSELEDNPDVCSNCGWESNNPINE